MSQGSGCERKSRALPERLGNRGSQEERSRERVELARRRKVGRALAMTGPSESAAPSSIAVDAPGHCLALHVTPANVDDRAEVGKLAAVQKATGESGELIYVDQGYTGDNVAEAAKAQGAELCVLQKPCLTEDHFPGGQTTFGFLY